MIFIARRECVRLLRVKFEMKIFGQQINLCGIINETLQKLNSSQVNFTRKTIITVDNN